MDAVPIADVVRRMHETLDALPPGLEPRRIFLSTYLRTTVAVGNAVTAARFEDPDWVEEWDVVFAELELLNAASGLAAAGFASPSHPGLTLRMRPPRRPW